LKFVSNLIKKSERFFAPTSPSGVSAATRALFASFVKEDVYKANVEHVTMSLEKAFNSFELVSMHSFMHVSKKIDVIA